MEHLLLPRFRRKLIERERGHRKVRNVDEQKLQNAADSAVPLMCNSAAYRFQFQSCNNYTSIMIAWLLWLAFEVVFHKVDLLLISLIWQLVIA